MLDRAGVSRIGWKVPASLGASALKHSNGSFSTDADGDVAG